MIRLLLQALRSAHLGLAELCGIPVLRLEIPVGPELARHLELRPGEGRLDIGHTLASEWHYGDDGVLALSGGLA